MDKAGKFVTMFSQLEQMLGINVKDQFILNKLFPSDIISDIVDDTVEEEVVEEELAEKDNEQTEEDVLSLFESASNKLITTKKRKLPYDIFSRIRKKGMFKVYSWNLNMRVEW